MSISDQIKKINNELPSTVKLVAVSKFNPVEAIQQAYQAGQRIFGESRPQELQQKVALLPDDIKWHFIGHLQTNKLKMVLPYVELIHSVDSVHLAKEIGKQSVLKDTVTDILLEVNVSGEESKFWISETSSSFSRMNLWNGEVGQSPEERQEISGK